MQAEPPDLLLARRERDLLLAEARLRRENGLLCYTPHEKQVAFHYAAYLRRRYARTGNRFGKSEMGAAEDVAYARGERAWIPKGVTFRTLGLTANVPSELWDVELRYLGIPRHATKGLIVTTDWDKSTEIFTSQETGTNQGKLWKYIPVSAIAHAPTKNHSGAIDRVYVTSIHGGVSVIHLDTVKSYKQNPLGQESSAWDWVHIDEPCPEQMWKAIARGLVDRNGHAWFTCTPLTEPWIDIKFMPDLDDQVNGSDTTDNVSVADHWWMTGSMYDNPYNSPAAIELFISELTEEERETRISGIPAAYSGIVYKEFKPSLHKLHATPPGWTSWTHPPADHTLRFAIDYHPRKNNHVLFIATSPNEVHYVYAELWTDTLIIDLVADIKHTLTRESTVPGLIDPLADTPNRVTDITPLEEVLRLGLPVVPATKDPYNGIIAVKQLLKTRDRTGALPILFVNPACKRFLFEISRGYIWDEDTNKPVKKNDDAMENFYRLVLQGLSYIEPATDRDYAPLPPRGAFDNIIDASDFLVDPDTARLALERRRHTTRYATGHQTEIGKIALPRP